MKFTTGTYLKSLAMLHKGLMGGVVLFSGMVVFLINKTSKPGQYNEPLHGIFQYVVPLVAVLGIVMSTLLYKRKLDAILEKPDAALSQKLIGYRTACLTRWAVLEAATLCSTIALFLTGRYYYIIFLFLLLLFFILYAPAKEQVIAHLQLNTNEQYILEDPYAEID
jgi:hypothetical protein